MPIHESVFRAYDIRGIYPDEFDEESAFRISEGLGSYFAKKEKGHALIIVGRDPRKSSENLYKEVVKGFQKFPSLTIVEAGLITTPMLYHFVNSMKAAGGVMVTASHNPVEYNGLKVVGRLAVNMSGFDVKKIIGRKIPSRISQALPRPRKIVRPDFYGEYARHLSHFTKISAPITLVVDCSNSAAGLSLKKIRIPGLRLHLLNEIPDGRFAAHGPNPLKPGALDELKAEITRRKADLGAILDADADRALFVDGAGRALHPDIASFALMKQFKPPFIADARAGWLLRVPGLLRSKVGTYFIKQMMAKKDASFAAETSGHYFFRHSFGKNVSYYDSPLRAILHLANFVSRLKKSGSSLSSWIDELPLSHRAEMNFEVPAPQAVLSRLERLYRMPGVKITHLDGVTVSSQGSDAFWFNIRPSNNEPMLRLSLEAKNENRLKKELENIEKIVSPSKSSLQGAI